MRFSHLRHVIFAICLGSALLQAASTPAAGAEVSCGLEFAQVQPMALEVPSSRLGWFVVGATVHETGDGYLLAALYVDARQQYERMALARFNSSGTMENLRWVGEQHESLAGRSAYFEFDAQERLNVAWLYEPIEIERFDSRGERDRSFGSNGVVVIDLEDRDPTSGATQVDVAFHPDGPVVIDPTRNLVFSVSADGQQVTGPYVYPSSFDLPSRNQTPADPFLLTPERHLIFEESGSIHRVELDGTPVTWWGSNGAIRNNTGNIQGTFGWYYGNDGSLIVDVNFGDVSIYEYSPAGQLVEITDFGQQQPRGVAHFRGEQRILLLPSGLVAFEDVTQSVLAVDGELIGAVFEMSDERVRLQTLRDPRGAGETLVQRFVDAPAQIGPNGAGGLGDQIRRLYRAYFLRSPGNGGLEFWRAERANGRPLMSVSDAFASSPEFVETYGALPDAGFVDLVYRNVLGRAGEEAGRAFWTERLAVGDSRGSVMMQFSESEEFVGSTATSPTAASTSEMSIQRLYRAYFEREADRGGLCFWASRFASGQGTLQQISEGFVQSDEFVSTYGAVDDATFVDLVYRNVLGRQAEAGGRAFWIGQLNEGFSRGALMVGFSESPEFILRTDTSP